VPFPVAEESDEHGQPGRTPRSAACCSRRDVPPGAGLLLGAVCGDPAAIRFGERAPESGSFEIPGVGGRAGLLAPRVIQVATVDS
jgi:hypothetical protein